MEKSKPQSPRWIANLRALMEAQGLNPRSLSLKAGLNATAVRDMLEGRTRFPRYDTVQALAEALKVAPAQLMGGPTAVVENAKKAPSVSDDDLELLTEIITRLQEVAAEYRQELKAREFAAMVTAIFRRMQTPKSRKGARPDLGPKIYDLMEYESLRRRSRP